MLVSSRESRLIPGFGGFILATSVKPSRKTAIECFAPINQPFTEYSVIRELLKRSEDAIKEVGQEYVLSTSDLGVCKKTLPRIWKYPDNYSQHVVTIGPIHTMMNYMGVVTAIDAWYQDMPIFFWKLN